MLEFMMDSPFIGMARKRSWNVALRQVEPKLALWKLAEPETAAFEAGIVISALRTYDQWDSLPQGKAIRDFPIHIQKIAKGPVGLHKHVAGSGADKCLRGLRVVEMSRVI
jgi:hypothetical protein